MTTTLFCERLQQMIRVFPRRTHWTPDDELAFIGDPPLFRPPDQPVFVSVTFTWDLPEAERLQRSWKRFYPDVRIGGPATGEPGGQFVPGRFLKEGAVITSRGCPNQCWFCHVWKREPILREFEIKEGWNVFDDNLLACSENHFFKVCLMLKKQKHEIVFSGGLEAKIFNPWHAQILSKLKPRRIFFAYDTEDDYEPLLQAGKLLRSTGFTTASHRLMCYVLIGYKGDTFTQAETRLKDTLKAGYVPMAMLYRNERGKHDDNSWLKFQKHWARPRLIFKRFT